MQKKIYSSDNVGESETTIHNKITVNVISFIIIYDGHCLDSYMPVTIGVINNVQL